MLTTTWLSNICAAVVQPNTTIWVAYSGGVDSHVLLHLASNSFKNVRAVHINHGLSPNASQWQRHCMDVCNNLEVELQCITVDATPAHKQSPEDAARQARRNAWQNLLGADDLLLTAHHAADQAETILYRLCRGTGPDGLQGMQQLTTIGAAALFRPFLNASKQQILDYALANNLQYIVDESNANNKFDRNYLRNIILPLITERWPAALSNINRSGALTAQLSKCLQPMLDDKLKQVLLEDNSIDIKKLLNFEKIWQQNILRAWLQIFGVTPSLQQITLVLQEVVNASPDAHPRFKLAHKLVTRNKKRLQVLDYTQEIV